MPSWVAFSMRQRNRRGAFSLRQCDNCAGSSEDEGEYEERARHKMLLINPENQPRISEGLLTLRMVCLFCSHATYGFVTICNWAMPRGSGGNAREAEAFELIDYRQHPPVQLPNTVYAGRIASRARENMVRKQPCSPTLLIAAHREKMADFRLGLPPTAGTVRTRSGK
jgi:hypothetical protein